MEHSIRITSDGKFLIKREDTDSNKIVFDILENVVSDKKALSDFFSQWPDRQIFFGDSGLCG